MCLIRPVRPVLSHGPYKGDPVVPDGEAHRAAVEDVTTATLRQVTLLLHNVTDKNKEQGT